MNLLMVNYMETTAPGGINTVVREVGRGLGHRGHRVTVLQPNARGRPREEMCDGFEIQRVNVPLSRPLYGFDVSLRTLKERYRVLNPDVVHVHGYHSLFSPEMVYLIRRIDPEVPLIFSYHLDVYRERLLARWLWNAYKLVGRKMVASLTWVISVSQFEAETLVREFHVPPDRMSIIPLGVRVVDTHKTRPPQNGPRILYAGYMLKRKNIQSIVESLAVLVHVKGVDGTRLTIVGEGPERTRISRLVRQRHLEAHVAMKPFQAPDDLRREMKNADVFVLVSKSEAYGIAVAEALALGTPCVVTNTTALKEFTREPGCFGVDYPPDPETVAQRIIDVYERQVQVGPFSTKIRTWDAVSRAYESLYCRCVNDPT